MKLVLVALGMFCIACSTYTYRGSIVAKLFGFLKDHADLYRLSILLFIIGALFVLTGISMVNETINYDNIYANHVLLE